MFEDFIVVEFADVEDTAIALVKCCGWRKLVPQGDWDGLERLIWLSKVHGGIFLSFRLSGEWQAVFLVPRRNRKHFSDTRFRQIGWMASDGPGSW